MKIGMVAYATEQGLGYLAKSFYDAGIVERVLLIYHGKNTTYPEWYGNKAIPITQLPIRGPSVDAFLREVDLVLFFETAFDWHFPDVCRSHGVRTVCIPMYEWFPKRRREAFDGFLCPSLLDVDYFPGNPFFQPPVDPSTWKLRTRAKRFVHNAGHIGHRGHKGTLELMRAAKFIGSDLSLTIRCQEPKAFDRLLANVPEIKKNPRVSLEPGAIPREDLYSSHDVMVAPEKFNGLSLPLQEAYAAGLLVMTTNRYPANRWLPAAPLLPVESVHKASISGNYFTFEESMVNPRAIAEKMDEWYDQEIAVYSLSGREWGIENSWEAKKATCLSLLRGIHYENP